MNDRELQELLDHLIHDWENEVVEFKQASKDYSTSDIGKYFSALANEANLRAADRGWLIFGVDNKTRSVIGTGYRKSKDHLQSLKMQIADDTEPSMTLRNIHELFHKNGRVLFFEIPAAPAGVPIAWNGHYYARAGESLTSLGLDKQDEIRKQVLGADWSAQILPDATLEHLDEAAVEKARQSFITKYANRFEPDEVKSWPLTAFLDRARLTREGRITRTTLLLLGKSEAAHFLLPHPAQLTWKLEGEERAYEHFGPPFLLNTTRLYQQIRNVRIRILPDDALLAVEVSKYDRKVILEALHNCMAHQDYTRNGRIILTELPDKLILENEGTFFEGRPADYVEGHKTPRRYRNPFLVQAMAELNMIDTMGYGIHEMHVSQARRYFPMPDYDLQTPEAVGLTVHGRIVDPAYSRLLMQKTDLPLSDVLALDRIQKNMPLDDTVVKRLRRAGLIEGRKPNLHVSAEVAKATKNKAEYIRTRGQDDAFYSRLVEDYLRKFEKASRSEVDNLLWDKLSDVLDEKQKKDKISNLLTKMRRSGRIRNTASKKAPIWQLAE